jgi:hypothetical protein
MPQPNSIWSNSACGAYRGVTQTIMSESDRTPPRGRPRLLLGIFLLLLGGLLLALNLGMSVPWDLWKYFPGTLVALGIWALVSPGPCFDRVGGIWLVAGGLYGLCGIFRWFGLGWVSAWPIFLVAAGLALIVPSGVEQGPRRPASDSTSGRVS